MIELCYFFLNHAWHNIPHITLYITGKYVHLVYNQFRYFILFIEYGCTYVNDDDYS